MNEKEPTPDISSSVHKAIQAEQSNPKLDFSLHRAGGTETKTLTDPESGISLKSRVSGNIDYADVVTADINDSSYEAVKIEDGSEHAPDYYRTTIKREGYEHVSPNPAIANKVASIAARRVMNSRPSNQIDKAA